MAIPHIDLPVPYERIPGEVKRILDHCASLASETAAARAVLAAIQASCPHLGVKRWRDRSDFPCSRCDHCGKEW